MSGAEIRPHLRRLVRAIRSNRPNTRILIRADSHYCSPQVIDWCRANDVDFILGLAPTTTYLAKEELWRLDQRFKYGCLQCKEGVSQARAQLGPASESLQGTNPRGWRSRFGIYGDLTVRIGPLWSHRWAWWMRRGSLMGLSFVLVMTEY